jgi:hypothetical protein
MRAVSNDLAGFFRRVIWLGTTNKIITAANDSGREILRPEAQNDGSSLCLRISEQHNSRGRPRRARLRSRCASSTDISFAPPLTSRC